jgi:predicted ATPase
MNDLMNNPNFTAHPISGSSEVMYLTPEQCLELADSKEAGADSEQATSWRLAQDAYDSGRVVQKDGQPFSYADPALADVDETVSKTDEPRIQIPEVVPQLVLLGSDEAERLDRIIRNTVTLESRRDYLASRQSEQIKKIGEAKGRQLLRPEIESVIEDLQRSANERSVGTFEKMLTAITNDVVPNPTGSHEIKLVLTTERNMPALDILITNVGEAEDITSGAILDTVSTGLRFITLARSGLRQFIVLDETDKQISKDNTNDYFNVVNQLSKDAGIQTIIITHNDLSNFYDDFRVYHIDTIDSDDKFAARLPVLISPGNMHVAKGQEDHVSWLSLDMFEAFPSAKIEFAPGVTAFVGPNNHGKSAFARAFKAAVLGEGSDRMIRNGKPKMSVSIGFSDGRVLHHSRNRKGTPKASYILHSEASWLNENITPIHHTPGAKLPEWISKETGLATIDGIDVQFWGQIKTVFMLDEPPSKRASLLSVGRESGHLYAMNEIYKEDIKRDTDTIREGEKEISVARMMLASIATLPKIIEDVEDLRISSKTISLDGAEIEKLQKDRAYLGKCEDLLEKIIAQRNKLTIYPFTPPQLEETGALTQWINEYDAAKKISALKPVNTASSVCKIEETVALQYLLKEMDEAALMTLKCPALPTIELCEIMPTEALQRMNSDLSHNDKEAMIGNIVSKAPEIPAILETEQLQLLISHLDSADVQSKQKMPIGMLPPLPVLLETDEITKLIANLQEAEKMLAGVYAAIESAQNSLTEVRSDIARAVEVLGNQCPVCHGEFSTEMVMGEKEHTHKNSKKL